MYLNCHVTSHDNLSKGPCKFVGGSSWEYVTILVSLVTISIVIVEICFYLSHDLSEHMFKGLYEFMGGRPLL